MISYKSTGIESESDMHESKIVAGIKEGKNTGIKGKSVQFLARRMSHRTPAQ